MNAINTLAFRIFGEKILEKEDKFALLRIKLRQAQIPLPVEQYVSTAILFSLLAGILEGLQACFSGVNFSGELLRKALFQCSASRTG